MWLIYHNNNITHFYFGCTCVGILIQLKRNVVITIITIWLAMFYLPRYVYNPKTHYFVFHFSPPVARYHHWHSNIKRWRLLSEMCCGKRTLTVGRNTTHPVCSWSEGQIRQHHCSRTEWDTQCVRSASLRHYRWDHVTPPWVTELCHI